MYSSCIFAGIHCPINFLWNGDMDWWWSEVSILPAALPGSTATFSCDSGFTISGTKMTVCQPNGQWSPPWPECKSKEN